MSRVCVFVCEGKSDKAFLVSLLIHKFDFLAWPQKNPIIYYCGQDPELYWIFPKPAMGVAHKGGKRTLAQSETYAQCEVVVDNNKYNAYGTDASLHYRILRDTDNLTDEQLLAEKAKIIKSFNEADVKNDSMSVYFAYTEIESWFISGLQPNFPYLDNNLSKIRAIAASNPDKITNPKESLDSILQKSIRGDRYRIATDFGEYMDLGSALGKSNSFKNFIDSLKQDHLLPIS